MDIQLPSLDQLNKLVESPTGKAVLSAIAPKPPKAEKIPEAKPAAPLVPVASSGGALMQNKWVMIGGAVVVGVVLLMFLRGRK